MDLSEALNVVQQVKNRYQAFQKLEEVLAFTISQINAQKEIHARLKEHQETEANARAQIEVLQGEIADLNAQRVTINKANEQRAQELAREASARHEKANKDHSERMSQLDSQYTETKAKLEQEVSDLRGEVSQLNSELAAAKTALEHTMTQHAAVQKELRTKLGLE